MKRFLFATAALVVSSGCLFNTSDDIAFQAVDAGADGDVTVPDMPTLPDLGGDSATPDAAPDFSIDFGNPDLSSGGVCPDPPTPEGTPLCNPVTRDGCSPLQVCDIGIDAQTQPPTFFYECRAPRALELAGGTGGDNCDASEPCQWGHRCVQGTCHAYCQFEDGLGCRESEQCDVFFDVDQITHFGLCVDTCGELQNP